MPGHILQYAGENAEKDAEANKSEEKTFEAKIGWHGYAGTEVPNELKLSDRGWRRKSRNTEKTPPPASVRWSAWLGPPPTEGLWTAVRTSLDSGGGMMGAAAGKG